jgi:NADP-dependent 3-hydroxy acid dehydrogenase YdfG
MEGSMARLAGEVAIVTGAGIANATAGLFADGGASIVVTARRRHELDALVAEIEGRGAKASSPASRFCSTAACRSIEAQQQPASLTETLCLAI